jgi:hypothetical protein
MQQSRWSPADLDRQRLVVRRIALRAELDLRELAAARDRLVAEVRNTLGAPLALIGCFIAGAVVGRRASPGRRADSPRRGYPWPARAATILRTLALGAPAYSALLRSVVTSSRTHAEHARDDVAGSANRRR